MKLYLSSYHLSNHPEDLSSLFGQNKMIAIIPNAWDNFTDLSKREQGLQREKNDLTKLGLIPEVVDLRDFFGKPEILRSKLSKYGGIWAVGGNTFVLRRAYHESGMDDWLKEQIGNREFVYAGYSAGICVLSPSLRGLETIDSPSVVGEGYPKETIWEGLGLIDFAIAPHYQSNHPESDMVNDEVRYYENKGIKYRALHDGEAIVMETAEK